MPTAAARPRTAAPRSARPFLLVAFPLALAQPAPRIEWSAGWTEASARARAEGRAIFVAVNADGEARSERLARSIYRDKEVVLQAAETVNVVGSISTHGRARSCARFPGITCEDHRRMEALLRERVLRANGEGVVAAPQHAWLRPDGSVLLSVPFELASEELAWCFVAARRALSPEAPPDFPPQARPPRRLLFGATWTPAQGDLLGRGLTPGELETELSGLRSGGPFRPGVVEAWRRVLFTDEKDALDHARSELGSGLLGWLRGDLLVSTIHLIGSASPRSFHEVLEHFARDAQAGVRAEAAVAYEQLGAPDALKTVRAALAKEGEPEVRASWLRALGACGRDDAGTRRALLKEAGSKAADASGARLRRNALVALGHLAQHADVRAALSQSLDGAGADERLAAACAMALARDPFYVEPLAAAAAACADEALAAELTLALRVLRGADAALLEAPVRRVAGDRIRRERVFFGSAGPARAGEEGEGDGEGGQDGDQVPRRARRTLPSS